MQRSLIYACALVLCCALSAPAQQFMVPVDPEPNVTLVPPPESRTLLLRQPDVLPADSQPGLDRALAATCRLRHKAESDSMYPIRWGQPRNSRTTATHTGTGVAFREDGESIYVLTAAHVIGEQHQVDVEFFVGGKRQPAVSGRIVQRVWEEDSVEQDLAVVRVAKQDLHGLPEIIPLAAADRVLEAGEEVLSAGCAFGAEPIGWAGTIEGQPRRLVRIAPAPVRGRSGSGLLDWDAKEILGIIVRRNSDNSGIAVSAGQIRELLDCPASK